MSVEKCPECGVPLAGVDRYKHAIACFHLEDRGVGWILSNLKSLGDEVRQKRIAALLGKVAGE